MSFTAVMASSRRVGGFGVPSVHSKFGFSASNHEPVNGAAAYQSTNFTSKFLYGCHAFVSSVWAVGPPQLKHTAWRETCSLRWWRNETPGDSPTAQPLVPE